MGMIRKISRVKKSDLWNFIGLGTSLALMLFFMTGELNILSTLFVLGLLCIWGLWSASRPLLAFGVIMFIWVNLFNRTGIFLMPVQGYGNRGYLYLGNVLLLIFVLSYIMKKLMTHSNGSIAKNHSWKGFVFAMPFLLCSTLLPLLGILSGTWPISYASPSVRSIQWFIIALISFVLCGKYGHVSVARMIFSVLTLSCIIQAFYASFQFYYLSTGKVAYLYFDKIFVETHPENQLQFYRATGLTVDPNSLGLVGMIFVDLLFSMVLSRSKVNPFVLAFAGLSSVWVIIISGSRTALVALICLSAFVLFVDIIRQNRFSLASRMWFIAGMSFFLAISLAIASYFTPGLTERVLTAFSPSAGGLTSDVNFSIRLQLWKQCFAYLYEHPFGTFVPPFYALNMPIDSYWVYVVAQGSLLYLSAFVLFLVGLIGSGLSLIKSDVVVTKCTGYFLVLLVLTACVESIAFVSFLDSAVIFLVYTFTGVSAYARSKTRKSFNS